MKHIQSVSRPAHDEITLFTQFSPHFRRSNAIDWNRVPAFAKRWLRAHRRLLKQAKRRQSVVPKPKEEKVDQDEAVIEF